MVYQHTVGVFKLGETVKYPIIILRKVQNTRVLPPQVSSIPQMLLVYPQ